MNQFAAAGIAGDGADRHGQSQIRSVFAVAFASKTMGAAPSPKISLVSVLDQSVVAHGGLHKDVSAPPSVATARPSSGNELFPSEGNAAAPAVSRPHADGSLIQKHPDSKNKIPCREL